MISTKEKIEEIKNNGYQLDFGNVLDFAFNNYKKIALYAGLAIFVFSILIGILTALGVASFIDINTIEKKLNPEDFKPENLSSQFYLLYFGCIILFTLIITPFTAGFYKMAHYAQIDKEFHVSTLFSYYKAPFIKEIVVSVLILTIVNTGLAGILEYVKLSFVGTLISLTISFFTFLSIPLIIFGNLNAIDAIKSSCIIVLKQPINLIGLLIVACIGTLVGFIGCCIGLFFTLPFIYSMQYSIYCNIIGIDSENDTVETE